MKKFFLQDPKLLIYGFLIVFFASYGQTFFISLFNIEIKSHYKLTNGQFGLIYSLATTLSSLILISFAKLIDFIDLRIYSLIISIGMSLGCLGVFYFYDNIFYLIFIIFLLRFFGQGAMSHAGETTMARYFGNNRGKAISVATLGGMLGVMFLPLVVIKLFDFFNLNQLWLLASISILMFLPIMLFILKNQKQRHSNFKLLASKDSLNKRWRTRDILFDKKFFIYLPLSIAAPFISTGLFFHQIVIFQHKEWTMNMLGTGYIFLGFFSIIGLIVGGPLIDKLNTRKTVITVLFPLFISVFILLFFKSLFFQILYMSMLGLNLGISAPFLGALWAELYGVESLGTVKALLHAGGVLASALSPFIFGYLFDWGFSVVAISLLSIFIIVFSTFLPIFKKI